MITNIHVQKLRNSEFLQFITDTLAIVSLNNPQALLVQNQYDALLAAKAVIDGLFNKEQASQFTEELIALDATRDSLIIGINALIEAHIHHFDTALKQHAIALRLNITSYGVGITRENYQSETAIINNLIDDWTTKPELAAAITALNLGPWKAQLETANANFSAKYLSRTQEMGATPAENMKTKRQEASKVYYELRDFITSYATINRGAAPFGKTVNELNALIDQYTKLTNNGRGRASDVSESNAVNAL